MANRRNGEPGPDDSVYGTVDRPRISIEMPLPPPPPRPSVANPESRFADAQPQPIPENLPSANNPDDLEAEVDGLTKSPAKTIVAGESTEELPSKFKAKETVGVRKSEFSGFIPTLSFSKDTLGDVEVLRFNERRNERELERLKKVFKEAQSAEARKTAGYKSENLGIAIEAAENALDSTFADLEVGRDEINQLLSQVDGKNGIPNSLPEHVLNFQAYQKDDSQLVMKRIDDDQRYLEELLQEIGSLKGHGYEAEFIGLKVQLDGWLNTLLKERARREFLQSALMESLKVTPKEDLKQVNEAVPNQIPTMPSMGTGDDLRHLVDRMGDPTKTAEAVRVGLEARTVRVRQTDALDASDVGKTQDEKDTKYTQAIEEANLANFKRLGKNYAELTYRDLKDQQESLKSKTPLELRQMLKDVDAILAENPDDPSALVKQELFQLYNKQIRIEAAELEQKEIKTSGKGLDELEKSLMEQRDKLKGKADAALMLEKDLLSERIVFVRRVGQTKALEMAQKYQGASPEELQNLVKRADVMVEKGQVVVYGRLKERFLQMYADKILALATAELQSDLQTKKTPEELENSFVRQQASALGKADAESLIKNDILFRKIQLLRKAPGRIFDISDTPEYHGDIEDSLDEEIPVKAPENELVPFDKGVEGTLVYPVPEREQKMIENQTNVIVADSLYRAQEDNAKQMKTMGKWSKRVGAALAGVAAWFGLKTNEPTAPVTPDAPLVEAAPTLAPAPNFVPRQAPESQPKPQEAQEPSETPNHRFHTVSSGDTLWEIADTMVSDAGVEDPTGMIHQDVRDALRKANHIKKGTEPTAPELRVGAKLDVTDAYNDLHPVVEPAATETTSANPAQSEVQSSIDDTVATSSKEQTVNTIPATSVSPEATSVDSSVVLPPELTVSSLSRGETLWSRAAAFLEANDIDINVSRQNVLGAILMKNAGVKNKTESMKMRAGDPRLSFEDVAEALADLKAGMSASDVAEKYKVPNVYRKLREDK